MAPMRLWAPLGAGAAQVQLAAALAGVELDVVGDVPQAVARVSALPAAPALQTPSGVVVGADACCKALCAGSSFYPAGAAERAAVDMWVDIVAAEAERAAAGWLHQLWGLAPPDAAAAEAASARASAFLGLLDSSLQGKTYLVADRMTLADVAVAGRLLGLFTGCDPSVLAPFPRFRRYMENVLGTREAQAALKRAAAGGGAAVPRPLSAAAKADWPAAKVRQTFVDFFVKKKQHTNVVSSAVVPLDDPTLLFTNAGMNQFKPIFLGKADPRGSLAKLKRAANSQKCIRAGGKHNDLDDVGKDTYHHTMFEMLGNWSFGDYFKREAITWAWELLTEVFGLDPTRLYATYFGGSKKDGLPADEEAKAIWLEILPPERVLPFDSKDNFWEMGDQGPCGPCTEIHYDRVGGRDAAYLVNDDDPDCIEIWNLVFIQFNREEDGSLKPLPSKHVDTGMGFERLVSILQDQPSNYDTDCFLPLFDAIQKATGAEPYTGKLGKEDKGSKDMAYRVIADHIRTLSFAIADGAAPGNEGRDYVLRRVLRRAVRFGNDCLSAPQGFFSTLVPAVQASLGATFPELISKGGRITEIIRDEEKSFERTIKKGIEQFKKAASRGGKQITGEDAFLLYDTYGFPVDLTQLMAEERDMTVDMEGYKQAMAEAKKKSKEAGKGGAKGGIKFEAEATAGLAAKGVAVTDQEPKYVWDTPQPCVVRAILTADGFVDAIAGGAAGVVLDRTPFYAEQGGQIYDTGALEGSSCSLAVDGCQVAAGYVLHTGELSGPMKVGDKVTAKVDYKRRSVIAPNHTMTHVLNFALRKVCGDGIDQKGSLVDDEKLRFDFSYNKVVDVDKLAQVDKIVNEQIGAALGVSAKEVPLAQAKAINGLRAVFGEVYPDPVRVVSVGPDVDALLAAPAKPEWANYSIEFCGGTHLTNTKQAERFMVIQEEGIAKGVRRITAFTGPGAAKAVAAAKGIEGRIAAAAALPPKEQEKELAAIKPVLADTAISAVKKAELAAEIARLGKALVELSKKAAEANKVRLMAEAGAAVEQAKGAGKKYYVLRCDVGTDAKALGDAVKAAQKEGVSAMIVSADNDKGKAMVYVGVAPGHGLDPKGWLMSALGLLGGKGGGGKDGLAQGQGSDLSKLVDAAAAGAAMAEGA